jgi:hypothetical protein
MQSQPVVGSMSSGASAGAGPGDCPLLPQSTRSETSERYGSPGTNFDPVSRIFSQIDSDTDIGHATTQPMAISGRLARCDSNDSMYGFARSPVADELRCRKFVSSILGLLTAHGSQRPRLEGATTKCRTMSMITGMTDEDTHGSVSLFCKYRSSSGGWSGEFDVGDILPGVLRANSYM